MAHLPRCAPFGAVLVLFGCTALMTAGEPPTPATARVRVLLKDGSVPPPGTPVNVNFTRAPPNQGGIGRAETNSDGVALVPIRFLAQRPGQPRDSSVRIESVVVASSCMDPSESGGNYGQVVSPGEEISLEYRPSFLISALKGPPEQLGLQLHVASDSDAASAIRPASALVQSMGPGIALANAQTTLAKLGSDPCGKYLPKTQAALSSLISELQTAVADQRRVEAKAESARAAANEAAAERRRSPACKIAEMKIDICQQQIGIDLAQWQIQNEREVGARTGYVRPQVIHDSGQAIIVLEQQRDALLRSLQSTYGVAFSLTRCGRKPHTIDEVRTHGIPSDLAAEQSHACALPKSGP